MLTARMAHILKHAGYPQPTRRAGQFWYDQYDMLWFVYPSNVTQGNPNLDITLTLDYLIGPQGFVKRSDEIGEHYLSGFSYAPPGEEILQLLKCGASFNGLFRVKGFSDSNMAKAAAKAYIYDSI